MGMKYNLSFIKKPEGTTHFLCSSGRLFKNYSFSWFNLDKNKKWLTYRCDSDEEYCGWYPADKAFYHFDEKVLSNLMEIE